MRTLISAEELKKRVQELGKQITEDYEGKDFTFLIILKGSTLFGADLFREIKSHRVELDCIRLSSYHGTKSTGSVSMDQGELARFEGRNLLIVEDIVDTGTTLSFFLKELEKVHPESVKICSLFEKKAVNRGRVKVDYLGFDIRNE
ncbi:hypoxanthine phosphoribosyltransferase, partial [bacterium]|nr:hypoxanthine phosphoribosyltransferase [bacterium]